MSVYTFRGSNSTIFILVSRHKGSQLLKERMFSYRGKFFLQTPFGQGSLPREANKKSQMLPIVKIVEKLGGVPTHHKRLIS